MSSSKLTAALVVALSAAACHKGAPADFAPQPSRVEPGGGRNSVDVAVTITGEHFYAHATQSLSAHGGVSVDDAFSASLDGVELQHVVRVSDSELRAVVPHGLSAGVHALTVRGPTGQTGSLARGWIASNLPPPRLIVTTRAPAQVSTGQSFNLAVEVQNTGGATALKVSPSMPDIAGSGLVTVDAQAPVPQDIPGGESRVFSFAMVAASAGTISVSATASGMDEVSASPVDGPAGATSFVVQDRAVLDAAAEVPAPQVVSVGQTVSLSLVVTNLGSSTALQATFPEPVVGPSLQLVASPAPQDIPGSLGSATFTWTYQAVQSGFATGTLDAGVATDTNDGGPIPVPAAAWPNVVVQVPAQIVAAPATTIPAQISVGQSFTVSVVVTNLGEATAAQVLPSLIPGGDATVSTSGRAPVAVDIAGTATATYSWSLTATGAGTFSASFAAAGTDANSGAAVEAVPSAASSVLVQTPAEFSSGVLTLTPLPERTPASAQATNGQTLQLTLVATNIGQATADNVAPFSDAFSVILAGNVGPGQAGRIVTPPVAKTVPGGKEGIWTWTVAINGLGGPVGFTVNGGGSDHNSGASALLPQTTSNPITVLNGSSLTMTTPILSSARLSSGQDVVLSTDVTNIGDVSAMNVLPTPKVTVTGTAAATTADSYGATEILAQTTQHFQWTFHVTGTGTVGFAVTARGSDQLSNLLVQASGNTGNANVVAPAALIASVQLPAFLTAGQATQLVYRVTNTGTAIAKNVVATATGGGVTDQLSAAKDILAGATVSFPFPYTAGAPGTLNLSVSASGTDQNSNAAVSVGPATGSATVQSPPALIGALRFSHPSANVGQGAQLILDVTNNGQATAAGFLPAVPTVTGSAAQVLAQPAPADVPGGTTVPFAWSLATLASGNASFSASGSATDANNPASTVSLAEVSSGALLVQMPAQIAASIAIPQTLPLGDSFTASMTVTNLGEATANLTLPAAPSVSLGHVGAVTLVSATAGSLVLDGSKTSLFTWTFTASGEGSLQLDAQVTGSDANDGTAKSASTSSNASTIAEAVTMSADPFGADGTTFASLASLAGQLWIGPNASGDGAVRMNGDGSGVQTASWQLEHPAASNPSYAPPAVARTIGFEGCSAGSPQCGPDGESGRGLFFSADVSGTQWLGLAGAHANPGSDYARFLYLANPAISSASVGYTDFAYADLSGGAPTSATTATSAAPFRGKLYVGFQTPGGPALGVVSTLPSALPGSSGPTADMGASIMPGIGGTGTAMIDSMAVFGPATGDTLYLANAKGFTRTSTAAPGQPAQCSSGLLGLPIGLLGASCGDWSDATPNDAAFTGNPIVTTKTSDLEPADRAVPAMASFNGRLYAARNTTAGPQLWACKPSSGTQCNPGDWSLVVANTAGISNLTQFNDPANTAITLLAATSQHLYVGFNNATRGVVLYRATTPPPPANANALNVSQFQGRLGGPAIDPACTAGPGGACPGFGGDGLGLVPRATRIFDAKVINLSGTDNLYLAVGTGSSPVHVFRAGR